MTAVTAGTNSASPTQSMPRRGARERLRGRKIHAVASPSTEAGRFTKNSSRQLPTSSSSPPTAGPNARPMACAAPCTPTARPSRARGTATAIRATLLACSIAAPTACSTRNRSRTIRFAASAQPSDAAAKTANP